MSEVVIVHRCEVCNDSCDPFYLCPCDVIGTLLTTRKCASHDLAPLFERVFHIGWRQIKSDLAIKKTAAELKASKQKARATGKENEERRMLEKGREAGQGGEENEPPVVETDNDASTSRLSRMLSKVDFRDTLRIKQNPDGKDVKAIGINDKVAAIELLALQFTSLSKRSRRVMWLDDPELRLNDHLCRSCLKHQNEEEVKKSTLFSTCEIPVILRIGVDSL